MSDELEEERKEPDDTTVVWDSLKLYRDWLAVVSRRDFSDSLTEAMAEHSNVDWIDIAQAALHRTRTCAHAPREAAPSFASLALPPLQSLVGALDKNDEEGTVVSLKCLLIIPQFALAKQGMVSGASVNRSILQFREGPGGGDRAPSPLPPELDPLRRGLYKAAYLAGENLGKASQLLDQLAAGKQGVLSPTEQVLDQLRAMHPPSSEEAPPPPLSAPSALPVCRKALRKAADRINNGSAPDLFGWSGGLVRQLVYNKETQPLVARLVQAIRDGCLPPAAREWLLASWLLPLDKGNGAARPIAGGTQFVKLAGAYLMQSASADTRRLFRDAGVQCGVFTPDGTTAAVHYAQNALDLETGNICIKVDFSNAFNALSRRKLLHECYQYPELSSFYRLMHWAYSAPSALLVRGEGGDFVSCLRSEEGVRQGCVLGPLAFAVTTLKLLSEVRESFPSTTVTAYLDDTALTGKPQEVASAFEHLCKLAEVAGLSVNKAKCEILRPIEPSAFVDALVVDQGLRSCDNVLPFLGSVISHSPARISEWVEAKIESWKAGLHLLTREEIPAQLALHLARWAMVAKPNSLSRSLPPACTTNSLAKLDETVIATLEQRLGIGFSGFAREMLTLPLRDGGVGFCRSAQTAPHAFTAGMAASSAALFHTSRLKERGAEAAFALPLFQALNTNLSEYVASDLKFEDRKHFTSLKAFLLHFLSDKHARNLQSRLMRTFRSKLKEDALKNASPEEQARLACRANKSSSLVWKAFPLKREFRLTEQEVRFLVAYATGSSLPELPAECHCRTKLTLEHMMYCGKTKLTRHNMLQSRLAGFARQHCIAAEQNIRLTIDDDEDEGKSKTLQEPDIIFYTGTAKPLETDVTVINPMSHARLREGRSAFALNRARASKISKYRPRAVQRGHTFAPLAFETHGRMGEEVSHLLRSLAANLDGDGGFAVSDMALDLAITLVRGNARCARRVGGYSLRAQDLHRQQRAC